MKNKFIIDKEINLNENDFLNTKVYADNLTKIIKNAEPNKVFTIGLFGNWGTGKSSIIKTSQQDFDETKIKFITYDAWQYINDSFRRMFLLKLREDLKYDETSEMKRFYENESTDLGSKYQLSPTRLGFILGGLILLLAILSFIPFDIDYKLPIFSIFTLLGLLISIVSGAFHQLKISVSKPHLFAPEQFEDCFKDIISNSLKTINPILKKWNWITKNDNSIQNLEKLVIVIDNMDRCSNDMAYNLLTDIKTFLGSGPYSIVFVIPVDDEALKKHIIKNYKPTSEEDICDKEKEEFLRKFFNVTIRIKPYGETDMYSFAKKICEKTNIDFKPETINVASKEYARNPRRIIQLFNNLLAEMNYYETEFISRNETLICCILIIKEEYPAYYKEILNSPKTINDDYTGTDENVKRFNRIAHTALGKIGISDLNKILTNSYHQFDNIAIDIKDAINTFDSEKIISVWETNKEQICDYIIDQLNNSIKNKLIESDLVAYFDLCSKINISYSLEKHFTKRIDENILPHISTIISKTKSHTNLCKYALTRELQKDNKIKNFIINDCTRVNDQNKDNYWESLFKATVINFSDKTTSTKLASTFDIYHNDIIIKDFSKDQIEFLITNKYIQDRIAELPINENKEISTNTDTKEYKKVSWLFEKKNNISQDTYGHLFAHTIGSNDNNERLKEKSNEEIIELLNFINPLLKLIPDKKLDKQSQSFYSLIVSDREMPNPKYNPRVRTSPPQMQFINQNFINDCITTNKYISEITLFIFNIYRITGNNTNTKNEINRLIQQNNLNQNFTELIDKNFSLSPIIDIVFDNNSINIESSESEIKTVLKILKHCFNQKKNDNEYYLDNDKSKLKLDALLLYAYENKNANVFALLEELIQQEHYKKILSLLIIEKESSIINNLPSKLLKLAISSFNKDSYIAYSNNFEFLSVIMQNGNNTQKGYVIRILTDNLINNKNVDNTITLISSMKDIPSYDKSGLLYSHLDNYQQENKESIDDELNKKIDKLKKMAKA